MLAVTKGMERVGRRTTTQSFRGQSRLLVGSNGSTQAEHFLNRPHQASNSGHQRATSFPVGRDLGRKVTERETHKAYLHMILAFQRALGKVDRCSLFRLGCRNLQISRQCFAIFVLMSLRQRFCATLCLGIWSALYSSSPSSAACL